VPPSDAVAFTILTGWLGAGKTTTVNRMLGAPHGRRIAVLVNELGRIAIDTQLIVRRGNDVLELAGGCVCCKVDVKSDLWDGIDEVVRRSRPDHVVLETTGIAEPDAIIEGFHRIPAATRARIAPAGVICTVDAEAAVVTLPKREEARAQIKAADRILLTKLDVATAAAVNAAHAAVRALNPTVERASFPDDDAGAMAMTGWLLERKRVRDRRDVSDSHPDRDARRDHDRAHRHSQIVAVAFSDPSPLVGDRVLAVARGLGDRLVRAKGFVHLAGETRRGFLEKAGLRTTLRFADPWGPAPPRTELVFIGDDLDSAAIHRALWACRCAE
jgi:G3E family GTPase